MSYYIVDNDESTNIVDGPFKNKDDVIFQLELLSNTKVFKNKAQAKIYLQLAKQARE